MAASETPTTGAVRQLIQRILDLNTFSGREQLLTQVGLVEYVDGPTTMRTSGWSGACSPAIGLVSPVPFSPTVVDEHGEPIGELLFWLDTQGYINCLERLVGR